MRTFVFLLLVLAFAVCGCKRINKEAVIIKDCTGTYLRIKGKDYHVCNYEIAAGYASGTEVTATFKKINECNDPSLCLIAHQNEGWIEVEEIR